jgi:hypothetical protein
MWSHRRLLLTGDQHLRRAAGEIGVAVHAVLWLLAELRNAGNSPLDLLVTALETWRDDPVVLLPVDRIESRLRVLRRFMR